MDKPLPLPQVQKIAGHKEISTTMRYVHTDGIEDTTARQWSREHKLALRSSISQGEGASVSHLKVVTNG